MKCPLCKKEIDYVEYLMTGEIKLNSTKLDWISMKADEYRLLTVFCPECKKKLDVDSDDKIILSKRNLLP